MTPVKLTWRQVNAWRVAQHALAPRLPRRLALTAATRVCGLQAQVLSSAELALWARVDDLAPDDVSNALWRDRTLVKTWAMRGALHLLPAADLPLFSAARQAHDSRNWLGWFAYYGLSAQQYAEYLEAVAAVLTHEPLTRDQLAEALAVQMKLPQLSAVVSDANWGSPLKPSAFRGDLCFGPSQGTNVTFVSTRHWLGEWTALDPRDALREIFRRFLRAYGPTTHRDFAVWWWGGGGTNVAKQLIQDMAAELTPVSVEGWPAYALTTTLAALQNQARTHTVSLLPLFDAYTLGLPRDLEPLVAASIKKLIYRPQGWISAVVLVDGLPKGTWEYQTKGRTTTVRLRPFTTFSAKLKSELKTQADRLQAYLGTALKLEYI